MKIRTSNDLLDYLDKDLSWRRREIIELRALATRAKEKKADVHVRAGIALVYAHWEGFVKNSANAYIRFIASRGELTRRVQDCFIALSVRSKIVELAASGKSSTAVPAVSHLLAAMDEPLSLDRVNIHAESNLNSDVFINIAGWLGIATGKYSTRFNLIDETLLASRNKIAHGEHLSISPERFETLAEETLEMMEWFKTDIENAVALKSFLRSS
jgi:hypothetical protein